MVSGKVPATIPDPTVDTDGLLGLLAMRAAVGGSGSTPSTQLVGAMIGISHAALPNAAAGFTKLAASPSRSSIFAATEQEVINANKTSHSVFAAAVYLSETLSLDYPVVRLTRPSDTAALASAAKGFEQQLRTAAAKARFSAVGLRDAAGNPVAGAGAAEGVQAGTVTQLPKPTSAQALDMMRMWSAASQDSRLLAVIDVSGSMGDRTGNGQTKIQLVAAAAETAVGFFPQTSDIGLAGKVLGALDVRERVVLIDRAQSHTRQRFALGHELGHAGLPWHRDAYFADDYRTLDPDAQAELEAEANSFSADILFNLREFGARAHSTALGLSAAIEIADVFETSRQAAIRRYVEDSPRPCALLVLGRFPVRQQGQPSMKVLRAVDSASFRHEFGPASALFPATFPIGEGLLGESALSALQGSLPEPIAVGEHVLLDSVRGAQTLTYEVFSNTYAVFALLYPKQRRRLGKRVRLAWTPEQADTA